MSAPAPHATRVRRRSALAAALVAALALAMLPARAQDEPDPTPGAEGAAPQPLAAGDLVVMDFQDVEIATLVKFISEITGKNFLLDDKVKGKVSVISPSKITVQEAYRVFQSVLQVKGFTLVDTGPVVKIVAIKDAKSAGLPVDGDVEQPSDTYVTQLVPLEHLEAQAAAALLQPLVSRDGLISAYTPTNSLIIVDSEVNIARLVELILGLDVPGQERTVEVIPLKHAFAGDVATILREAIEDQDAATRAAPGTSAVPGVGAKAQPAGTARGPGGLRVVPDERSNAVIVIGNQLEIRQAYALINKLDRPLPKGTGRINVYYLRHADATEMVQVLAELVGTTTSTVPRQILPGRAVTEGGGRFGSGAYRTATGSQSLGDFGRSTISRQSAGALPGTGRAVSQPGTAGGVVSAGSGGPAVEFESGVRVTADPATNSLVISAAPQDYAVLRAVIEQLDIPRRQVLVEAIIFEVSLTRARQLGIELQGGTSVDGAVAFGRVNFRNLNPVTQSLASGDVTGIGNLSGLLAALISEQSIILADGTKIPAGAALLSALEADTDINVLSAPTIMTTDNEEAEIVVGQNVPFVTSRSTNETNLENTFSQIDRRDVGITLRLTPQISEGDTVRLLIFQEVSALVPTAEVQVLQLGPTTTVRSATTSVVVKDNQTVAIGGLISDTLRKSESSVPYLSDIPVLGNLFKFDDDSKEKVNLIILLTPRILRNPAVMASVSDEERRRFRAALTGRGMFAGTRGSAEPPPPEPRPPARATTVGVLLPAENGGAAGANGGADRQDGVLLGPEGSAGSAVAQ
ncbi:MAG: type II secretion system secretin GspD [Thermodesulfobacteriota bacterium]